MNKKLFVLIVATIFLLVPTLTPAQAIEDHITLLTVAERGNQTFGGTADMYLEITEGTGKVFIDSFPLTQLDTQISTRYAKEVACDYVERSCEDLDFFYTIRASSSVVGGPSAGAATTILTAAMLEGLPLNDETVITGTINSGGFIGPVSGIDKKVEAAQQRGFETVVLPKYSVVDYEGNSTVYGDEYSAEGIDIVPITTLDEAMQQFTGQSLQTPENITPPNAYQETMGNTARMLCQRMETLFTETTNQSNTTSYNESLQAREDAQAALQREDFYSAASFCFTANIRLRELTYDNVSEEDIERIRVATQGRAQDLLEQVENEDLTTISDVEASIIVKERLYETLDLLGQPNSSTGYIVERLYSAEAWASFFDYPSTAINLDQRYLRDACLSKIAEAEERVNYLGIIQPGTAQYRDEIDIARDRFDEADYTYCLFKASKVKAEANAVISTTSITQERFPDLVDAKLDIAKQHIGEQDQFFPILGYSYYNYAESLKDENPSLAQLFTEYSSEFSALDMYLNDEGRETTMLQERQSDRIYAVFFFGFASGAAIAFLSAAAFILKD